MPILTQAPDPNPKIPKLVSPPGACDTHIHLFRTDRKRKYAFASDSPYTSRDALPEALIGLQDTLGLSTAVIVSDLLLEWVPDAATRKRILVDNACALYGFPLPS